MIAVRTRNNVISRLKDFPHRSRTRQPTTAHIPTRPMMTTDPPPECTSGFATDPVSDHGRDQVASTPQQSINEHKLMRSIPLLDHRTELVHRQQVQPEVDQAEVNEVTGHEPPDLSLAQLPECEVAEATRRPGKPSNSHREGVKNGLRSASSQ